MKKQLLFLIIFTCVTYYGYTQTLYYGFPDSEKDAEITFTDGHLETGKIYGFIDRRSIYLDVENPFKSIERRLNLTDKIFHFDNGDGNKRKIKSDQAKKIKITENGKDIFYERLYVKTVNSKGKIIDLKRQVWLPYFYLDHQIGILGLNMLDINKNYAGTLVFLKRVEEDFVINSIDYNRLNIFNFSKFDDKMYAVFRETFRDCKATVEYIDYFSNLKGKKKKKIRKEMMEKYKTTSIDEGGDLIERQQKIALTAPLFFLNHYNQNCPDTD